MKVSVRTVVLGVVALGVGAGVAALTSGGGTGLSAPDNGTCTFHAGGDVYASFTGVSSCQPAMKVLDSSAAGVTWQQVGAMCSAAQSEGWSDAEAG